MFTFDAAHNGTTKVIDSTYTGNAKASMTYIEFEFFIILALGIKSVM